MQIGRNFVINHFVRIVINECAKIAHNRRATTGLERVAASLAEVIGNDVHIDAQAMILSFIAWNHCNDLR